MDIVDTFNHLIPSDQLDDSLLLGQNLESEASDEFGPSHHLLEDSLKNMLSDKDPMLGSASTQFHLLDNDEANFEIAGSTGLEMMNESESGHGDAGDQVTRPKSQRGRPKGASRATRKTSCGVVQEPTKTVSSLASHSGSVDKPTTSKASGKSAKRGLKGQEPVEGQEEPDNFSQDKTGELPESGISHQQIEQSMNPVVVLRRLTVTVGGYKIELLPGPSKTSETAATTSALAQTAAPSLGLQESTASPGDLDLPMAQDQAVNTPCTAAEAVDDLTAVQDLGNGCIDEATTELGPYVNPNEVQEGPGVLLSSLNMADVSTAESKPGDQTDTLQANSGSAIKPDVDSTRDEGHIVHPTQMDKAVPLNAPADKESLDQKVLANKQLKSKQLPSSAKQKKLVPNKSNKPGAEPKTAQQNKVARSDIPDMQAVKEKQAIVVAKRRSEHLKTYPPSKMQRMQDGKPVKPPLLPGTVLKSPDPSRQVVKRPLTSSTSPDSIRAQPPGVSKALRSQFGPRAHNPQATVVKPGLLLREHSEEDEQERLKTKKAEKALQKQKSKGNRGLSVDEPPLFIPDNAPVVKKEAHEDDSTDSETVWDPSKHCGFCKKPHNNRFMVGCGRCDDWFHGDCVGLDLAKAQQMEQEDQEYVCLKCCAKEDRKVESEAQGQSSTEAQIKPENPQENKLAFKHERHGSQLPATAGGRMFRKDSIERKQSADVKDTDQKGGRMKPPQTSGDPVHKTVAEKQEMKKTKSSPAASKKPSVEQIRRNVRDSLKDILLKRLNESNLKISVDRAANVATKTEKELFSFFRDTDSKYKSKYRSLMFNLKDVKNHVLFKRVLKGEITPNHLIRMSPEELASKELAAWRQRENRHTIEMIEKEQREVDRRPITKITHKGEIEIENQEPVKEPEAAEIELEPVAKPLEEPEVPPQETELESAKDTTSQHKAHLFDLNCKICTGRMAPPVEDSATKVVKVATSVMRRQSSTDVEGQNNGSTSQGEELLLSAVEDVLVSPRAFSDGRSGNANSREDETTFLNRLESLWKGFVNMPSVAKFVTKAYPVSGIMDHLTEDLPDSIQVGGRISPQTVWDYVEKIRASGTKEVCLIRFAPVTEEDEISYTLLYAYFSSRKRYGVVANNMKQVKDMYLIPLGSSEKIPHQLVPFDGPGLETNRSNLLLGLIIRQRVKRDFGVILPVEIPEASTSRFLPESRTKLESSNESGVPHEEKGYLNSLNVVQHTEAAKPQHSSPEVAKLGMLPVEKSSSASDVNLLEPTKPLRFLPGVLVGWEGQSPPAADAASRPSPAGEAPQSGPGASEKDADKQGTVGDGATKGNASNRSPASNGSRLDRFIIKKKEPKPAKCEPLSVSPQKKPDSQDSPLKQSGNDAGTANLLLSLKDKPPDVSTEAFFATLTTGQAGKGPEKAVVQSQEDSKPEDGQPFSVSAAVSSSPVEDISKPQGFSSPAKSQRQSMGGILKNSSTLYKSEMQVSSADPKSSHAEEKGPMQEHSDAATHPVSLEHPEALNADKQSSPQPVAAQHGRSYEPQSEYKPLEDIQSISTVSSFGKAEDHVSRPGLRSPPEAAFSQGGHGPPPPAPAFPPVQAAAPEFQYQPVPVFQVQANAQQAPPSFSYPGPAPLIFPQLDPTAPWPPTAAPPAGFPPSQSRFTESSKPAPPATRDDKGPERRYSDPWERQPRHLEDGYKSGGDHYARQRHYSESHPDRKGRHHERDHERERGKHWEHQSEKGGQRDRSRSRSREDKHRDSRSRHPSHSGVDHHTDRWKERRHADRDREREKDKHRRDSDYDKGRKGSKDGRT